MANRDIVSEAVEQAEAMKQAAYENAKNVLVEAMSTNLKAAVAEAIDTKLDGEDVDITEDVEETTDVVAEETTDEAVEEGSYKDADEVEMDEMEDEDEEDDEDDDEEVDIDIDIDADDDDDDEEDLDEADLDEVIEIVEDEDEDMDEGEHEDAEEGEHMDEEEEDDDDMDEIGKMKYEEAMEEVEKLRTENKRYAKALKVLRTRIEEVNLFNARLAAATDVMNQVTLTKEQKERVVEHFDSCDTLDEVTRMAGVLKEAHEASTPSKNRTQRPNVQSVISENKTEAPSGFDRLTQLAGL